MSFAAAGFARFRALDQARELLVRDGSHRAVGTAVRRCRPHYPAGEGGRPAIALERIFGFVKVRYRGIAKNAHREIS